MDESNINQYVKNTFNIKLAKYIACFLIVLLCFYHGYLNIFYGHDSCNRLLEEGHILGDKEWQPLGCMMHNYSRIQLYNSFIKQIDPNVNDTNNLYKRNELNFEVEFIYKQNFDNSLYSLIDDENEKKSFILINIGLWYIEFNNTDTTSNGDNNDALEWYKANLTTFTANFKDSSNIHWILYDPVDEYKLKNNTNHNLLKLNNKFIDLYNRETIKLLSNTGIKVWSSNRLVSQGYNKDNIDGFKLGSFVLNVDSQILYNLYCNNKMNYYDGTCCSKPENSSLVQKIVFVFYILCILLCAYFYFYEKCIKTSNLRVAINGAGIRLNSGYATPGNATNTDDPTSFIVNFCKLAFIMIYFYAADRANYFMKENKHYTLLTFLIPLLYVSVLGIFFHGKIKSKTILNRTQTYELKGFMQAVILIYRISGAQKNLFLFMFVRIFNTVYIFLSGYGHFNYYWNTPNYSPIRFFQILFRLNFLTIILCLTMKRMYQFYAFVPFITFSFICLYIVLIIPPRVSVHTASENSIHYFYMLIKILLFIGLITLFNMSEIVFEKIFLMRPWKFLFIGQDDLINEWKRSWNFDSYTILYGMLFGLLVAFLKQKNLIANEVDNENTQDSTESLLGNDSVSAGSSSINSVKVYDKKIIFNKQIDSILTILSILILIIYSVCLLFIQSEEEYNELHRYLSVIPIICYILIRNLTWFLRKNCSYMFNWFGKITLELYLCSYHILLAADSNGILVFLPGYPVLNLLLTTFIFICISHELNLITTNLCLYFIPLDWKICLRNFLIFFLLLMPFAIKYGYI